MFKLKVWVYSNTEFDAVEDISKTIVYPITLNLEGSEETCDFQLKTSRICKAARKYLQVGNPIHMFRDNGDKLNDMKHTGTIVQVEEDEDGHTFITSVDD